jgi:bifunctional non-homologous end joining protein LigD
VLLAVWTLAKAGPNNYLRVMFKPFEFCVPTRSTIVPSGPDWLHEIKYDGYRRPRAPDHQGGYNWTDRYPWIVEAARKNRIK